MEKAMKIGYARTSTVDQLAGLEAQQRDLKEAGVEKTFAERVSSVNKRPQPAAALDYCREGGLACLTKSLR